MTCAFRCVLSEFLFFFFFFSSAASNTAQMRSVSALAIRLSYMPSQHVQQTCCMPCETLVFGFSLPPYFFCLAICFLPFSLSLTLTLSFHHLFFSVLLSSSSSVRFVRTAHLQPNAKVMGRMLSITIIRDFRLTKFDSSMSAITVGVVQCQFYCCCCRQLYAILSVELTCFQPLGNRRDTGWSF